MLELVVRGDRKAAEHRTVADTFLLKLVAGDARGNIWNAVMEELFADGRQHVNKSGPMPQPARLLYRKRQHPIRVNELSAVPNVGDAGGG